jgi:hypothetical protein
MSKLGVFTQSGARPDYALLRIKASPELPPLPPVNSILNSNEHVCMIHHPGGLPLAVSDWGQIKQVGEDYIDHAIPTGEGSSGAPIFNQRWEFVGLHRGDPGIGRRIAPGTTEGVPIYTIWEKIKRFVAPV